MSEIEEQVNRFDNKNFGNHNFKKSGGAWGYNEDGDNELADYKNLIEKQFLGNNDYSSDKLDDNSDDSNNEDENIEEKLNEIYGGPTIANNSYENDKSDNTLQIMMKNLDLEKIEHIQELTQPIQDDYQSLLVDAAKMLDLKFGIDAQSVPNKSSFSNNQFMNVSGITQNQNSLKMSISNIDSPQKESEQYLQPQYYKNQFENNKTPLEKKLENLDGKNVKQFDQVQQNSFDKVNIKNNDSNSKIILSKEEWRYSNPFEDDVSYNKNDKQDQSEEPDENCVTNCDVFVIDSYSNHHQSKKTLNSCNSKAKTITFCNTQKDLLGSNMELGVNGSNKQSERNLTKNFSKNKKLGVESGQLSSKTKSSTNFGKNEDQKSEQQQPKEDDFDLEYFERVKDIMLQTRKDLENMELDMDINLNKACDGVPNYYANNITFETAQNGHIQNNQSLGQQVLKKGNPIMLDLSQKPYYISSQTSQAQEDSYNSSTNPNQIEKNFEAQFITNSDKENFNKQTMAQLKPVSSSSKNDFDINNLIKGGFNQSANLNKQNLDDDDDDECMPRATPGFIKKMAHQPQPKAQQSLNIFSCMKF